MKHTAQISFDRATCSCGTMRGIWRGDNEPIGAFTLRAHGAWELHRDGRRIAPEVRGTLFDYAVARETACETATLF